MVRTSLWHQSLPDEGLMGKGGEWSGLNAVRIQASSMEVRIFITVRSGCLTSEVCHVSFN